MTKPKRKPRTCCICDAVLTDYGHNPLPLAYAGREGGTCCDWCNRSLVIPCRIRCIMVEESKR